ncbi:TonB-dependent receptor [Novosphingobium sp. ZN18A2]|uniref:TonB-dependent receptor n=1 Tax=Novosphingobium sp. ZN18A2 TaxID=3079861 RepID=UPI0030CFDC0E
MTDTFAARRAYPLSRQMLMAGVAAVAVAAATPAFAQSNTNSPDTASSDSGSTDSGSMNESAANETAIVVTGYRQSVDNAIRVKKNAIEIVESVSAEDVGKLPTNSITDALATLPGVTAQRLDGRADVLAVRGFGPNFTTTTFNGREIATISDDRGFQYDQIPAELISRADVTKTSSADLFAQGIAGTVNLMTIDPLAQDHRILSISGKVERNAYSKEAPDVTNYGYRGTIIYADKFADGTLGISLGGTILSSPQQERQYQAWGYPTDANGNYVLGGAKYFATGNIQERQSGFGSIEWQPSDKFEMAIDGFYSHFKTKQQQRGLEVPLAWGAGTLDPASEVVTGNVVSQMTYNNEYAVQRNNYNRRDADTYAIGWNGKYHFSDRITFTLDANYSRAHRNDYNLETYTGTCYNAYNSTSSACVPDSVTVTQQPNGIFALSNTLDYTDTNQEVLTDPLGWGYNGTSPVVQAGFLNSPDYVDEIKALRGDLQGKTGGSFFNAWSMGVQYSDRTKTSKFKSYFLNPGPTTADTQLAIPSDILLGTVNPFGFNGQTLAYDPVAAANLLTNTFDDRPQSTVRDWKVEEKVLSAYFMLNIDGIAGSLPIKGNIGVQVVHTDQSSTGNSAFLDTSTGDVTYSAASGGAKYTYVLPSATMKLEFAPNTFLVMAASQAMSRSEQGYEAVPFQISYNTTTGGTGGASFSGNGGNPALRPYLSTNIDVGVQSYFARGQGLLSVNAFYKNLTNFVDPVGAYFTTISQSAADAISGGQAANNNVLVTVPNNGGTGYVAGFEVQAEIPLRAISPALDGFGLRLNGTHNISSVSFADAAGNIQSVTVPGLSKWTGVVTGYFEKGGFSARATYQYRSSFLGLSTTVEQAQSYNITSGEGILSAQIGYEFQHGPLEGLSLIATGSNLTNAPFINYYSNTSLPINYETYGATYSIGASYKF